MQDIEELMQLAVDGTATPAQQAELNALLERSPEARNRYEDLQRLVKRLDAMPSVDPPAMRIALSGALAPSPAFRRRKYFALAYAAAALIVIGVAVYRATPPQSNTSATMTKVEEEWPVVARASRAGVTLTVRRNGDEYVATVTPPQEAVVEFDPAKLQQTQPNRFRRREGAVGITVIRLALPDNAPLSATVDLR